MYDAKHFKQIQRVCHLEDQDIIDWARRIEYKRKVEWQNNLPQALIDEVKANPLIMDCLEKGQKIGAIKLLRTSGITDMTLRENMMVIEAVMETL